MDTSLYFPFNGVQDVEKCDGRRFESQRDHQREHVGHHEVAEYDDDLEQGQTECAFDLYKVCRILSDVV